MLNKGFTLLEVIVAIFLLSISVIGILSLINQTIVSSQITSSRLIASYLAQEGIEIVKNLRDTNFLKIHKGEIINWYDNILCCSSPPCDWTQDYTCEGDYNDSSLTAFQDRQLKIDGNFYQYSASATETPFKRKIIIFDMEDLNSPPDGLPDKIKVQVEVSWQERVRTHQVTAQENIYQWLQ